MAGAVAVSICTREDDAGFGRSATDDAFSLFRRLIQRNAPDRGFRLVLDLFFAIRRTAPMTPKKPRLGVENLVELRVIVHRPAMFLAKFFGPVVEIGLNR